MANLIGSIDATTEYTYDPLHRLEQIEQYGAQTSNKQVDFVYNDAGQFDSITRYADSDGSVLVASSQYDYDGIGRLTGLTHAKNQTTLADYTWQYDAASRMTQMTSPDGTSTFTHDDTNQLTDADHTYQTDEDYEYDDNGNRTNAGYAAGENNRLTSDGMYNYVYDAEGNRTARFIDNDADDELSSGDTDVTEYTWDHRNRLTEVTDRATDGGWPTRIVEYTYNSQNRRVCKAVDSNGNGTVNLYHYDIYLGDRPWLEITDPDGLNGLLSWRPPSLAHRYLWGPAVDQILAVEDDLGDVLWGLADHQGTIRDIVNSTGAVVDHRKYDSFGQLTSNPAVDFIFGYTGKPLDPDTGLQYNHNRWYDSNVGRWLNEDFIPDDTNPYRYVGNGPMTATDPSGLEDVQANDFICRLVLTDPRTGEVVDEPMGSGDSSNNSDGLGWLDAYARWFNDTIYSNRYVGENWIYPVVTTFVSNETFANASDTSLAVGTTLVAIPTGIAIFAGGEIILGVGTFGGGTVVAGAAGGTEIVTGGGAITSEVIGGAAMQQPVRHLVIEKLPEILFINPWW